VDQQLAVHHATVRCVVAQQLVGAEGGPVELHRADVSDTVSCGVTPGNSGREPDISSSLSWWFEQGARGIAGEQVGQPAGLSPDRGGALRCDPVAAPPLGPAVGRYGG
jgi:hypothetical protein